MSEQEKVTCSNCYSLLLLRAYKLPARDTDTADCVVCGNVLRSWRGDTTSWAVDLIERKENHKQKCDNLEAD